MEEKNFKKGQIVVVTQSNGGNLVGTVTRIVSLLNTKKANKVKNYGDKIVACEAVTSFSLGGRRYSAYNTTLKSVMGFKTPCWKELIQGLRLATKEERQQYYRELQEYLETEKV